MQELKEKYELEKEQIIANYEKPQDQEQIIAEKDEELEKKVEKGKVKKAEPKKDKSKKQYEVKKPYEKDDNKYIQPEKGKFAEQSNETNKSLETIVKTKDKYVQNSIIL